MQPNQFAVEIDDLCDHRGQKDAARMLAAQGPAQGWRRVHGDSAGAEVVLDCGPTRVSGSLPNAAGRLDSTLVIAVIAVMINVKI